MNPQLVSLIEGVAPTLAGALGGPLAGAAVAALAAAVGAPTGADAAVIVQHATALHPDVLQTVVRAADANFAQAIANVSPAQDQSSDPIQAAASQALTHAGITNPTVVMLGSFTITLLGGILIHRGLATSDSLIALIGLAGTAISMATSAFHSIASNHNTVVLANHSTPSSS